MKFSAEVHGTDIYLVVGTDKVRLTVAEAAGLRSELTRAIVEAQSKEMTK